MKRIPYGVSDFKQIRREGLYYVDMMTDLQRYPMVAHSYILELKYLKKEPVPQKQPNSGVRLWTRFDDMPKAKPLIG